MPLMVPTFTGNGESVKADGVAAAGISYHILADDNVFNDWFGLPPTELVEEARTGVDGSVLMSNRVAGKRLLVVVYAVCNNAAAAWDALDTLNTVFDLTNGTQGSVSVDFAGQVRTLNDCERDGPSRATVDSNWVEGDNPSSVVWRYEVRLVSENTQWT